MGGHTVGSWFCIIAPHVAVVLGLFESFRQFFVALITFVGYFFMFLVGYLLKEQIQFVSQGQTKYENKKDIRIYNQGWRRNVSEILGPKWFLVFFWPWTVSKPGDGIHFSKSEWIQLQIHMPVDLRVCPRDFYMLYLNFNTIALK